MKNVGSGRARSRLAGWTERGLTLVEILVAGVVLALVSGVVLTLTLSGQQLWARTGSQLATLTTAQRALDLLTEDLHKARQGVAFDCTLANTIRFDRVNDTGVTYQCVSCDAQSPGVMTRTRGTQPPEVVVEGVTDFQRTCPPQGVGVVQIRFTTQATQLGRRSTQTLSSQVWIRNSEEAG